MKATLVGFKQLRPTYRMMFLKDEDGKSYITHISTENGNSNRWWNLKQGDVLSNLTIFKGNIVNADSLFVKE